MILSLMKFLIRQSLLKSAISGRHCNHYLWLLTQSSSAILKNLRRQAKVVFVWYPKERADLKMIHDVNNKLTDDDTCHTCLYIRNEHRRNFKVRSHVMNQLFFGL